MNINDLEKQQNEGLESIPSSERRAFLKAGLAVTGVFLGGSVLSLTSAKNVQGAVGSMPQAKKFAARAGFIGPAQSDHDSHPLRGHAK